MAAVAAVQTRILDFSPSTGWPRYECLYFLMDSAGVGTSSFQYALLVEVDPAEPFQWSETIEDAVIAHAAAQVPPVTVSAAKCLTPVTSDLLLIDKHSYNVPVAGFSFQINNNVEGVIFNPAGTLATGTVTMPTQPQSGRVVKLSTSQTITSLTLLPSGSQAFAAGSAVTTLAANTAVCYIWRQNQGLWFRWI